MNIDQLIEAATKAAMDGHFAQADALSKIAELQYERERNPTTPTHRPDYAANSQSMPTNEKVCGVIEQERFAAESDMFLWRELNFHEGICKLINQNSLESVSNTPDFVLASFLVGVKELLDRTINERDHQQKIKPQLNGEEILGLFAGELKRNGVFFNTLKEGLSQIIECNSINGLTPSARKSHAQREANEILNYFLIYDK